MRKPAAFQILESREADFGEMTWTFNLNANSEVYAGQCAILPSEGFMKMSARLAHAEGLLREVMDVPANVPNAISANLAERIERHFDPEPL